MLDVDQLVADCHAALDDDQPALAVRDHLRRVVARPTEIDAALGADPPAGLRCLHRSPELTILHLVWPPGVVLFPHEHGMWAANGIYGGSEDNTYYRREPAGTIVEAGGARLDAGEVALLGVDAIHAVANPRRSSTAAIHVYGGDYFATPRSQWDPATLTEAPFDVRAVERVLAEAEERARQDSD